MAEFERPRDHAGRAIDFGTTSADYERFRPGFPPAFFDALEERSWLRPAARALDLGTGTGSLALGLARRGLEVTGIDISEELLAVARRRAEVDGLEVRFEPGRAEQTGLASASVDLVTAGQCWWWFDAERTLQEIRRVLVPGGRVLIGNFSYLVAADNLAARTEALVLRHNPGWTMAGWSGIHPEQVQGLDQAGFAAVECVSFDVPVPFSHEAWRGRMRTCNGIGSSLPAAAVQAFDAELAALLEDEYPTDLVVPHRVFVATGVLPDAGLSAG